MEKTKRNLYSSYLKAVGLIIPDDISELLFTVAIHCDRDVSITSKDIQEWHDQIVEIRINSAIKSFEDIIKAYDSKKDDPVKLARTLAEVLIQDSDQIINDKLLKAYDTN
jgi:hypothetical protein